MGRVSDVLRRAATIMPGPANRLWSLVYPLFRTPERFSGSEYAEDLENTFTLIHDENRWGSDESVSGAGSTVDQTIMIRRALPVLMRDLKLTSLLDAPCGDFNWMRRVDFSPNIEYTGGDIVKSLIANLQKRYGDSDRRFVTLDIVNDDLPANDIWLCRDVLFHLSNAQILKVLANFVGSDVKFLLTTTYDFADSNVDITSGGFRFINLRKAPFELPRPRLAIDDYLAPEPPRKLGLWSRAEVAQALSKHAASAR